MQGDITRSTFKRTKHYDSVRMQQGRVQMDADWNEQMDIQAYQAHTTDADIIGAQGSPRYDSGFAVELRAGDLWLTKGRMYVAGILCENEADVPLAGQEDAPDVKLPTDAGLYLAYLDVWQCGVTALDDPEIREVALGGPDTATRTRVVWQARAAVRLGPGYRERYPDQAAAYDELVAGRGVGQPLRDALDTLR